ncbi:MAG: bifunctional phosphoglucose/phosphomannose isomerase [Gemmatimonadota bacterium]
MTAETGARGVAATHAEMKGYLRDLPAHLGEATARAREWARELPRPAGRAGAVALAGLGGSAVGGDLARALLRDAAPAPFEVVRDYHLPAWIRHGSAVLASSYSGNTEETLSAFDEARARGASVWVVTSGGELARRAEAAGLPLFRLPPGLPPRAALGQSLPPVLLAGAVLAGLEAEPYAAALEQAAERLATWSPPWAAPEGDNPALALAERLATEIPVFYAGTGLYEPAAVRWRAQLAENAKMLSFHHLLPEMDHNEIVGWQENAELLRRCRAVFLTGSHDHPRVSRRIEITAELIEPVAGGVEVVRAPRGTPAEELLGLVLLGDYVSLHAAAVHGVEPVPVQRISVLKAALKDGGAATGERAGPSTRGGG